MVCSSYIFFCSDNFLEVEANKGTEEYRGYCRDVFHTVIQETLRPLVDAMHNGVLIRCSDGVERLCFPVLCQYIADMEEQVVLASIVKGWCPKCLGPTGELEPQGPRGRISVPPRTDADARNARRNLEPSDLREQGYHVNETFCADYPRGGIIDSLGPDLLHQAAKCFWDHLLEKCIKPLILDYWSEKRKIPASRVLAEIDARFSIMPKYFGLRRFTKGIYNKQHPWMVHEYRAMMKVILGVLAGLCPKEGMLLLREYLIINYLSQYPVHNDTSLGWLDGAIDTFWRILRNPKGRFVHLKDNVRFKDSVVTETWAPSKLHYFRHYAQCVREKGALTSYSTDRTEIWHKILKAAYNRSNKIPDHVNKFIVTYVSRITAFRVRVSTLEFDVASEDGGTSANGEQDQGSLDSGVEEDEMVAMEEFEEDNPSTLVSWPKQARKGWPGTASDTESATGCTGFRKALVKYFMRKARDAGNNNGEALRSVNELLDILDPTIWVHNCVALRYSALNPLEKHLGLQSKMDPDSIFVKEYIRCPGHDSQSRRDCVLVYDVHKSARAESTMGKRRVYQLLMLFQSDSITLEGSSISFGMDREGLALVQEFSVGQRDANTGMYSLTRTEKVEVISIESIERGVHLIPKFGTDFEKVDTLKWIKGVQRDTRDSETGKLVKQSDINALHHYKHFFLNSWSDNHIYNFIW
jgi:hypothetical protein